MQGASQWTVRVDAGLPKARGGSADGCGHAFASLGRWGDGGTLAGKRPPHKPRSDHNKTRHRPARPRSKRRRGGATPAPFCCPSTKEMEFDFDLCGGIYPKGARHNGLLCGRSRTIGQQPMRIRRRYVGCRHTQQPAQPTTPRRNVERGAARTGTTAPAACEVVKRLRQRSGHTRNGAISRGQVHRLLRSVRYHYASEGAGLAGFIASTVTERSSHGRMFNVLLAPPTPGTTKTERGCTLYLSLEIHGLSSEPVNLVDAGSFCPKCRLWT